MPFLTRNAFWGLLVLALAVVYGPGLGHALLFDDARLTDGTIFDRYGSLFELRQRLLSYGSFVWVGALAGEAWWVQRGVNVLLHLGVVVALYRFLSELVVHVRLGEEVEAEAGFEASRRAALRVGVALFALNPVAVYAVAYLIQRSIVMATLFVVLAGWSCLRGLVSGRWWWFVLAVLGYGCAVLSKEHAVAAVALVVPLYALVRRPAPRTLAWVLAAAAGLLAVAVAVLLAVYGNIVGTLFDEYSRQYVAQLEALSPGVAGEVYALSVVNQAALFFQYGFLWFVPLVSWMSIDLRPDFPLSLTGFPHGLGVIGSLALMGFSLWAVLRRSDALGLIGFCLLLPLVLFVTEFALPWLQDPFVLYRSYLWAIGVPGLVFALLVGMRARTIYWIGASVALLFAGLAFERTLSLESELHAWSDAAEKVDLQAPPNALGRWRPFLNLGSHHLEEGAVEIALPYFEQADALGEPNGSARFNIGMALQLLGRHADAIEAFMVAESKGFTEGALYFHRAESRHALGRFEDAFADYSVAIRAGGDDEVMAHMRLRRAEAAIPVQRFDQALADFEHLRQVRPDDYRVLMGLGMTHVGRQDGAAAQPIFDRLIQTRPTAAAHYGRGLARYLSGDRSGALTDLDQAIRMDPDNRAFQAQRAQIAAQP